MYFVNKDIDNMITKELKIDRIIVTDREIMIVDNYINETTYLQI
jgi:hypothetical protein